MNSIQTLVIDQMISNIQYLGCTHFISIGASDIVLYIYLLYNATSYITSIINTLLTVTICMCVVFDNMQGLNYSYNT